MAENERASLGAPRGLGTVQPTHPEAADAQQLLTCQTAMSFSQTYVRSMEMSWETFLMMTSFSSLLSSYVLHNLRPSSYLAVGPGALEFNSLGLYGCLDGGVSQKNV